MTAPTEQPVRGVRLATIASVPVYLGWSWLVLGALIVFIVGPGLARGFGPVIGYSISGVYAVALLLSVLAHEAAHAVVARIFGHTVHRVVADLWGGHTAFDARHGTAWSAAAIAVVGPLANGIVAGLAFAGAAVTTSIVWATLLTGVAFVNGALAVFNLLPGLPLDGGQIVESLVWAATGDQGKARVAAGWAGRVLVILLAALFLVVPLARGASPDLTTAVWAAIIGAFLWSGATAAIASGQALQTLARVDLGAVIEPVAAIGADRPITELTSLRAFPVVVDGRGVPVGTIDHSAIRSVPPTAVASTPVSAVTAHAPDGWVVDLGGEDDALALVRAFQETGGRVVAVTRQGRLSGLARVERVNAALRRN